MLLENMFMNRHNYIFVIDMPNLTLSPLLVPNGTNIDFTLSNARRFYSSMGNPLGWKGLIHCGERIVSTFSTPYVFVSLLG